MKLFFSERSSLLYGFLNPPRSGRRESEGQYPSARGLGAAPPRKEAMIYLDNAATSWPKPRETVLAMADAMTRCGANPGRAGHKLAISAGRIVED